MKPVVILFVLISFFSSCKENSRNEEVSQGNKIDTTHYGTEKFDFPALSPNADTLVKDWPIFRDFQTVSIRLQNKSLEEYEMYSDELLAHTDSLYKNIPDTLFSPAIQSRLIIIKTRLSLLNQEAGKGKPNPDNMEQYIKETRVAIENFIAQINEKVEKDQIDILRRADEETELEKQQNTTDPDQFP